MTKHGEEYDEITDLDVGDDVDEDTFNTLLSGNKPRVVFSQGSVNEGDTVLFKAHTTFLPYDKSGKTFGKDEAKFHRWIPGYGAAHSSWKAEGGTCDKGHPLVLEPVPYKNSDLSLKNRFICNKCRKTVAAATAWRCGKENYDICSACITKMDVRLEEGEHSKKKQDTENRLDEVVSAWAVFSPEKKCDRNVTFETLSGGPGEEYVKFKVDTGVSKHGDSKDTVVIMAFGQ